MADNQVIPATIDISMPLATPDMVTRMKLDRLHQRIDKALKDNRQTEMLVVVLCTLLFLVGLGLFIAGYVLRDVFFTGSGVVVEIGLIWPIKRILDLRSENIQLSLVADMLDLLPPEQSATQLIEWVKKKWLSEN